jgi:hypothetical protein
VSLLLAVLLGITGTSLRSAASDLSDAKTANNRQDMAIAILQVKRSADSVLMLDIRKELREEIQQQFERLQQNLRARGLVR